MRSESLRRAKAMEIKERWYEGKGNDGDVVISSRIRLARNLRKYPFSAKISKEEEIALLKDAAECTEALEEKCGKNFFFCNFNSLLENEKLAMVERHIVSPNFAEKDANTGLVLSEDESVSIMVNEEDHLRIQAFARGKNMHEVYRLSGLVDDTLEERLGFAFDRKYGYLTSCPTNVGTGLRASYMMFLPALTHTGNINKLAAELAGYGIALRGIYGENTENIGDICQISNQRTLGPSEREIIDSLDNVADSVVAEERKAREVLVSKHFEEIEDQIYRSYGLLKYARNLSCPDAITLLGQVKLGADTGILKFDGEFEFYKMMINIQRANLQMLNGAAYGNAKRGRYRAEYIRKNLPELINQK